MAWAEREPASARNRAAWRARPSSVPRSQACKRDRGGESAGACSRGSRRAARSLRPAWTSASRAVRACNVPASPFSQPCRTSISVRRAIASAACPWAAAARAGQRAAGSSSKADGKAASAASGGRAIWGAAMAWAACRAWRRASAYASPSRCGARAERADAIGWACCLRAAGRRKAAWPATSRRPAEERGGHPASGAPCSTARAICASTRKVSSFAMTQVCNECPLAVHGMLFMTFLLYRVTKGK